MPKQKPSPGTVKTSRIFVDSTWNHIYLQGIVGQDCCWARFWPTYLRIMKHWTLCNLRDSENSWVVETLDTVDIFYECTVSHFSISVISWQHSAAGHVTTHNDSDLVVTLSNENTLLLDVFSGDLIRQIKTIKWLKFCAPPTKARKWFATRDFVKDSVGRIRIQYCYLSWENRKYLQTNIYNK